MGAEKRGAGLVSPARCGGHSTVVSASPAGEGGPTAIAGALGRDWLSRGAFRSQARDHATEIFLLDISQGDSRWLL
jgi:hypothetical protein